MLTPRLLATAVAASLLAPSCFSVPPRPELAVDATDATDATDTTDAADAPALPDDADDTNDDTDVTQPLIGDRLVGLWYIVYSSQQASWIRFAPLGRDGSGTYEAAKPSSVNAGFLVCPSGPWMVSGENYIVTEGCITPLGIAFSFGFPEPFGAVTDSACAAFSDALSFPPSPAFKVPDDTCSSDLASCPGLDLPFGQNPCDATPR